MPLADIIILFIFGIAFGSFFNVIILRYDGEGVLADPHAIGGRSQCMSCHATLRWFELVPVVSFLIQGGRCRHCGAKISMQYPVVELLAGVIFFAVPWRVVTWYAIVPHGTEAVVALAVLWTAAFSALLIMAAVDLRLGIIPDEVVIFLTVVGVAVVALNASVVHQSFIAPIASVLGDPSSSWVSAIIGALVGVAIFGGLWFGTRGKGMGMGDVKLAGPLGILFGWPDILALATASFILGALVGVAAIAFKKKDMQSAIPFGPFLALGAVMIFFLGSGMAAWYLHLMNM